jgi:hypothetical protein
MRRTASSSTQARLLAAALVLSACAAAALDFSWMKRLWPAGDFHTELRDARGLKADAVVRWRGLDVGRVRRLRMTDSGRVRVDFDLEPTYRRETHAGLRAWADRDWFGRRDTRLRLIDARNVPDEPLPRGSAIPEARLHEAVTRGQLAAAGALVLGTALVLVIARGLRRLLALAVIAVLVAGALLWVRHLSRHDTQAPPGETRGDTLQELLDPLMASPETQSAAESVSRAVTEAFQKIERDGPQAAARAGAELDGRLDALARSLETRGFPDAARAVRRVRDFAGRALADGAADPGP